MEDFKKLDMEQKIEFVTSMYSVPGSLSKEEAMSRLMDRIDRNEKYNIPGIHTRQRILYFSAAASIALIIALFFVIVDFSKVEIASLPGEQILHYMPDGSTVNLNADSEIKYSGKKFKNKRTLQLNGEAYFEVKEGNIFTIESKNGKVEVLGTSFNVHSRENYFKVSCSSGQVLVTSGNLSDTLCRGGSVSLINDNYFKYIDTEIEQTLNWRNGEFYYKSTELRFVLNEIERQFNVSIEAFGIENRLFTGSFYSDSLEEAIQIVCIPMDLEFKYLDKGKIRIYP
jgi:transmembrane sensor